jgi:hypothetical protein
MERFGDKLGKIERYCSTGQSPQRAVVPMEEEVTRRTISSMVYLFKSSTCFDQLCAHPQETCSKHVED